MGLAACDARKPAAEERAASRTRPKLHAEHSVHDFGRATEGEPLEHAFRLENRGSAAVRIQRVERAYACAASDPPERIAPNSSADLVVRCETLGKSGKLADSVTVYAEGAPGGKLSLEMRGVVEPLLAFSQTLVELQPEFGKVVSKDVRLTGSLAKRAKLRVDSISDPGPEISVIPGSESEPEGLRVSLRGSRVDRRAGHVVVSTGLAQPATLTLPYSWWVRGNLEIEPSTPYINLREPGTKQVVVRVKSSRRDFHLQAAPVLDGPFESRVEPDPDGPGFLVRIVADESRLAETGERGALGKLELVSNDPFEPRRPLSVFALGILNGGKARP